MKKLEIGYNSKFEIRHENLYAAIDQELTILYLSDFHLCQFTKTAMGIIDTIDSLNPDIVLLGGDYVDTWSGYTQLETIFRSLSQRKNVFAIAGNHDYFFGVDKIKKLASENNIGWIEQSSAFLVLEDNINLTIQIDGNRYAERIANATISILLLHKPIKTKNIPNHYQLILAGHLHGCQFVWKNTPYGLFPGNLFYRMNFLKKRCAAGYYLISKGLGDTLPLRYNCQKDVIFVRISNKPFNSKSNPV